MSETETRYFHVLPSVGQGTAAIEQIYPKPAEGEGNNVILGDEALAILLDPNRVRIMPVRNRSVVDDESGNSRKVYSNHRLEIQPGPSSNDKFFLPSWELKDEAEELIRLIEGQLCSRGLTIVLERGILERPLSQDLPKT